MKDNVKFSDPQLKELDEMLDAQLTEFRYKDVDEGMSTGKMVAGGAALGLGSLGAWKANKAIKGMGGYKQASVIGGRKAVASLPMGAQRKLMSMKWLKTLLTRGK